MRYDPRAPFTADAWQHFAALYEKLAERSVLTGNWQRAESELIVAQLCARAAARVGAQ